MLHVQNAQEFLYALHLRTFGKLGFVCLDKDDYTDCKFICGIADEGIMKSERLKWDML